MKASEMCWVQKCYVIIIVFSLIVAWTSREDVGFRVGLARDVMQCKMVVLKLCEPASLASVELLGFFEILQVGVVSPDLERMACVKEVSSKLL
jgi:hypothetical protein